MMPLLRLIAITVLATVALSIQTNAAEKGDSVTLRPIDAAVVLEAGGVRNIDTYLSPIRYSGQHIGLGFEVIRASSFSPERWNYQVKANLLYDRTENPVGNNTMHSLLADFSWSMMWRTDISSLRGLTLYVGPTLGFEGGVTYNPRNSNNVCSPLIYANVGATGQAAYKFKIGDLPVVARYQLTMPVVGCFYLPDYDQTFYEIYLGNYRDAVNFGWWKNRFDMDNLLTVDFRFGSASLRVGYRNDFTTIWENNISVRRTVHALVVGAAWESLRINPRKGLSDKARMVSAFY